DWTPGEELIASNLRDLVRTVTEEQLEVSHRRLFVKTWIRLLDDLRLGGERALAPDDVQSLVHDEQMHLLEEDENEAALTFFGTSLQPSGSKRKGRAKQGDKADDDQTGAGGGRGRGC